MLPTPPQNITVEYVTIPQPTPWEAEVRWQATEGAQGYIVQAMELSDTFSTWETGGLQMNVSFPYCCLHIIDQ